MKYSIYHRGEFSDINEKGEITRAQSPIPSGQWLIVGVSTHWNSRHFTPWVEVKARLDKGETVEGYVFDRDHGTLRQWGNGKARIQKSNFKG
jgi:hypothetical protein